MIPSCPSLSKERNCIYGYVIGKMDFGTEMEDYNFIEQYQTNSNVFDSVVEFTQLATVPGPGENLQKSSSSGSYTSCPTLNPKTNNTNTNTTTSTTTTATTSNGGLSAIEICKSSLGRPTKQIKTNTRNKVTGFAAEQVIVGIWDPAQDLIEIKTSRKTHPHTRRHNILRGSAQCLRPRESNRVGEPLGSLHP
ncbi:unnamed protein product [Camellia sinensis]